jgi:2-C-methyl-D-erythritol 4-phosphate cytidylyltransferase/2-C-methyl-D-erythritol 2,4-cyclodiphosphate synthase
MLCRRLGGEAVERGSAVPLLPVTDALKHAEQGVIDASVPREGLLATQTPQAFPSEEIQRVLEETPGHFSDEAEAWLVSGRDLGWTRGDPLNFKKELASVSMSTDSPLASPWSWGD